MKGIYALKVKETDSISYLVKTSMHQRKLQEKINNFRKHFEGCDGLIVQVKLCLLADYLDTLPGTLTLSLEDEVTF